MRHRGHIPDNAVSVDLDPKNAMLMCHNHKLAFNKYLFYIRWIPSSDEFLIVNHSQSEEYEDIHGRVLRFTSRSPYPTALLWHESRVRGFNPTCGDHFVSLKRKAPECKASRSAHRGTNASEVTMSFTQPLSWAPTVLQSG
ncbi:hypothetical protein CPB83DRAFT_856056 [Crepidotus variabilis]|uniref:Uncharacterized protein n=1 Tax=Crepidotus variabilis TaxID=179855 RepID=A0A9P6EET0_9AGAR|nr:hypothetical protein CPB83DRAFT_856056 [Crepidotus variabilis]